MEEGFALAASLPDLEVYHLDQVEFLPAVQVPVAVYRLHQVAGQPNRSTGSTPSPTSQSVPEARRCQVVAVSLQDPYRHPRIPVAYQAVPKCAVVVQSGAWERQVQ